MPCLLRETDWLIRIDTLTDSSYIMYIVQLEIAKITAEMEVG